MESKGLAKEKSSRITSRLKFPELIIAGLAYATINAAVYLKFGKLPELTLGTVALLTIPAVGVAAKSKAFLRSSILFITVILTYEALQGLTGALLSSGGVVSLGGLDRMLVGFDFTPVFQSVFASNTATLVSTFFYGLHVFLIVIAITLFWFESREVYFGYTYSMILTSYLALITFVILPSAPPWFVGAAKDLLTVGNRMLPAALQSVQGALLSGESDIFAAFPSLHAAYATLFSFFMFKLDRRYGLASLPVAVGVYFSIIYLGQHYLVDLLAGIAYAVASAYLVARITRGRNGKPASVTVTAPTH